MCGFVGFLGGVSSEGQRGAENILQRMVNTIAYRGPDDEGYWSDIERRIGLGEGELVIVLGGRNHDLDFGIAPPQLLIAHEHKGRAAGRAAVLGQQHAARGGGGGQRVFRDAAIVDARK